MRVNILGNVSNANFKNVSSNLNNISLDLHDQHGSVKSTHAVEKPVWWVSLHISLHIQIINTKPPGRSTEGLLQQSQTALTELGTDLLTCTEFLEHADKRTRSLLQDPKVKTSLFIRNFYLMLFTIHVPLEGSFNFVRTCQRTLSLLTGIWRFSESSFW